MRSQRHRRRPTLITSNLSFSDRRSFLKNDHLTAALIDRLTEQSHVITINMKSCVSLRPKLKAGPHEPSDRRQGERFPSHLLRSLRNELPIDESPTES